MSAAAPPAPTSSTIEVRDRVRLRVLRWDADADRTPFLLVHGLASNARLWTGVGERLAAAGHRVVAVDQRAHGRSDPSDRLDLGTLTDDLVEVADACGLHRPIVVGQSWGGNVTVELAARHPQRLRAVVGVDGGHIELSTTFATVEACWAALAPPDWDADPVPHDAVLERLEAATSGWPAAGRAAQLDNLALRADGTVTAILTRARHRTLLAGLHAHRPSEVLARVPVPVLLLPVTIGDAQRDAATRAQVQHLVDAHPHVTARWFHDRAHDVHAQAPHEVAAALLDHLATLDAATDAPGPAPDPEAPA